MPSDETWEATLNRVLPQALAMAVRVCGSVPAAEDAVQEGLVKILQARESYRGQAQLSTWMLQIVLNASRDWLRKHRPTIQTEPLGPSADPDALSNRQGLAGSNSPAVGGEPVARGGITGGALVGGLNLDQLANPRSHDPSARPIHAEERQQIRQAVEHLPARQREVVQLLIWQGMSATEVAELTGTTAQNVYANFHAAKQQLRVLLADTAPAYRPPT